MSQGPRREVSEALSARVEQADPPHAIVLSTSPPLFLRLLLVCILLLSLAGATSALLFLEEPRNVWLWRLLDLFHLDRELNVPAFFSSALILGNALLLGLIAWAAAVRRSVWRFHWALLAVIFVGLSFDEMASMHEKLMDVIGSMSGIFFFSWVVPGLAFVALIGVIYFPFLLQLPSRTRMRFLAAAATYVSGALGFEMAGGYFLTDGGGVKRSLAFQGVVLLEETLEMLGQAIFCYALLDYFASLSASVTVRRSVGSAALAARSRPRLRPGSSVEPRVVPAPGSRNSSGGEPARGFGLGGAVVERPDR